jgi:hypothetical protein
MTKEIAEKNIKKWFWEFKYKLVDDLPEYHNIFDNMISSSNRDGVLYEVLEFAYRYLEIDALNKGGMNNLMGVDYLEALDYGYNEWINK